MSRLYGIIFLCLILLYQNFRVDFCYHGNGVTSGTVLIIAGDVNFTYGFCFNKCFYLINQWWVHLSLGDHHDAVLEKIGNAIICPAFPKNFFDKRLLAKIDAV